MPIIHQKTFQELCNEITDCSKLEPIPLDKILEMNKKMEEVHQEYVSKQNIKRIYPDEIIINT